MFWTWVVIIVLAFILAKCFSLFVFPRILSRWFTLHHEISTREGYLAVNDQSYLLGREGCAATDLKPCGKAQFGADRFDVSCSHGIITKGTPVKVTQVQGNSISVEALAQTSSAPQNHP